MAADNRTVKLNNGRLIVYPEELANETKKFAENFSMDQYKSKSGEKDFLSAQDYVRGRMYDKIYAISHKPFADKNELGSKLKDAIFLQGLAGGLEELEGMGKIEESISLVKTQEYMLDNSKFREGFDRSFEKGAGEIYQAAFDAGVNKMFKDKDFTQLDMASVKQFNEICLDNTFNKIFEKLNAPNADVNQVIELGKSAGKLAHYTGVKPEAALDAFVAKHPNAVAPDVVNAVRGGFKPIAAAATEQLQMAPKAAKAPVM